MNIKVPQKTNIISHPLLKADFSFTGDFERRLNGFFGVGSQLQKVIDQTFMDNMTPYVPFDNGVLRNLMRVHTEIGSGLISIVAPQVQYLYYGMLMVDSETGSAWASFGGYKVLTDIPLKYHGGGQTGPFYDRRMWAERGNALLADWQRYVDQNF